jgi:hypothetical protein
MQKTLITMWKLIAIQSILIRKKEKYKDKYYNNFLVVPCTMRQKTKNQMN